MKYYGFYEKDADRTGCNCFCYDIRVCNGVDSNGSGGSVELGGTLTPAEKVTLWEVKTGDTVTNLDAQIQKGQQNVDIVVKKAIPVLGIRNADENGFAGIASGNIIPQITYENNAVDVNSFSNGITTLTLDVHNESGDKIGIMTTLFSAAAYSSWDDGNNTGSVQLMSSATGAYFGGLGKQQTLFVQAWSLPTI